MIRYLFPLIVFLTQPLLGQRLHFKSYPLLVNNIQQRVDLIDQDHEGLLWVVSGGQLFTFDGMNFSPVELPSEFKRKITSLTCSLFDDQSTWIGLENGTLLNNKSGVFKKVVKSNGPIDHPISEIIVDDNRLWLASYGEGVFVTDKRGDRFQRIEDLESQDIYSMIQDENDVIWLSTDMGISSCIIKDTIIQTRNYTEKDGLQDEIVKDLIEVNGDLLLASHEAGILRFYHETNEFKSLTPNWSFGVIKSIEKYSDIECWIVTERNGVFTLDLSTNQLNRVHDKNGAELNQVADVDIHEDGNVWLCDGSASLLRALRFFEFYDPKVQDIQMIYPKDEHHVYLGTNVGLYLFDINQDQSRFIESTAGFNIISMDQIGEHLLLGSFDAGLMLLNLSDESIEVITEDHGISNNSIITIAHSEQRIWLSTLAGVCHMEYQQAVEQLILGKIEQFDLLTRDYVYDILIEDNDGILFATDGHGVAQYQQGYFAYYKQETNTKSQILSLASGLNDRVWAIENTIGLCLLDRQGNRLETGMFTTGPDILSLASDGFNHLVVVHKDGIGLINEKQEHLVSYDVESGFGSFEPLLNSLVNLDNRYMFCATNSALVKILIDEHYCDGPTVLINFIQVGNRRLDPGQKYTLDADEHTVHFNLTGLYYANPESVKFKYKLEGHDETWKTTQDRNIIYSKLAPGKYLFSTQALSMNAGGQESDTKTFKFEIAAPIYQRWWFVAAVLLLGVLLVYVVMKYRERMLLQETELQNAVIERQYETLKNQLNPHFLFNAFNNLIGYIEEDPQTAVTVVERLSDFYRRILELKELKLVTVKQELDLLDDYAYLLNKRFDGSLFLDVDIKEAHYYIPPMTLQILVENAVKHNVVSKRYPLRIVIRDHDEASIEVFNEKRIKRTVSNSTGIGLQNISKRYKLLGEDEITIIDKDNLFRILIPKIKINKQ